MGTHPIFESDFDCLTECQIVSVVIAEKAAVVMETIVHFDMKRK